MLWGLRADCGSEGDASGAAGVGATGAGGVGVGATGVAGGAGDGRGGEGVGAAIGLGMAVLPASRISWRLPPRALATACSRRAARLCTMPIQLLAT